MKYRIKKESYDDGGAVYYAQVKRNLFSFW